MNNEFTHKERKELLDLARETIENYINRREKSEISEVSEKFRDKRGVFVTLHKNGALRGCIGYPLPISSLFDAVTENAISAAFNDPRFPALEKEELNDIDIEISVLTIPKRIKNPKDVRVGVDGIIVSKEGNRGLLLPQVPIEQGWNVEQYLSYGCLKAGLHGDTWREEVEIEVFQAEVFGESDVE